MGTGRAGMAAGATLLALLSTYAIAQPTAEIAPEPRLHIVSYPCGEGHVRRQVRKMPEEHVSWMRSGAHRMYSLEAQGHRLATIEVLSTADFRECDLLEGWRRRETQVRTTYFTPQGERVALETWRESAIFSEAPQIHVSRGRALFRGVTYEGERIGRWLEMPQLKEAYRMMEPGVPSLSSTALEMRETGNPAPRQPAFSLKTFSFTHPPY